MSGFLFNRQQTKEKSADPSPSKAEVDWAVEAVLDAQSITASAIFALLVSKGVLSAGEAAAYMRDIGEVLRRDVKGPLGSRAGKAIAAYGEALVQAER
jgi:hypothetical protein